MKESKKQGRLGALGKALMFVLGLGAGSSSPRGCFPLGVLCVWVTG